MSKNLVDSLFGQSHGYEVAVLSTFGLNLNFFENYLMRQDGLLSCNDICVFTDKRIYEAFIGDNYHPQWLNRKYLVANVPTNGIFHPKLYILASEKKAVIGIGSANLTREGVASNLEIISFFEVSDKNYRYAPLLKGCVNFFARLSEASGSNAAQKIVLELADVTAKLTSVDGEIGIKLLHNLDLPLFEQLESLTSGMKVKRIKVISPFYDSELKLVPYLKKKYPNCEIEIFLQQGKSNFPAKAFPGGGDGLSIYVYKGIERYIHGKAILFDCGKRKYLFTGSANFSDSALLKAKFSGNIEAGIWGEIDNNTAEILFNPLGITAEKLKRSVDIKTTNDVEEAFSPFIDPTIHFVFEVTEECGFLLLHVDNKIDATKFVPRSLLLFKLNGTIEISYTEKVDLKREGIQGKDVFALQVSGNNKDGKTIYSNTTWITRLEKRNENSIRNKCRRIFTSPFELANLLNEIMMRESVEELRSFLLHFDIPLDLILQSYHGNFASMETKGNIPGALPENLYRALDNNEITDLLKYFLNRLFDKLDAHYANVQLMKIPNFMLIYAALFSMLEFIHNRIIKENADPLIGSKQWAKIRHDYEFVLSYVLKAWTLFWIGSKERKSYKQKVDMQILKDRQRILGKDIQSFDQYLARDYSYIFEKTLKISLAVIESFRNMKNTYRIKHENGLHGYPRLFSGDVYLNEIDDIEKMLQSWCLNDGQGKQHNLNNG